MNAGQELTTGRRVRRVVLASALALSSIGVATLVGGGSASAGSPVTNWLDPSTTSPGGVVTVHGDCTPPFLDSARVVLMSTDPSWSNLFFAMNVPDPTTGVFSGSLTVPSDAPAGTYTAQLQCGQSSSFTAIADLPLTVVATEPTTTATTAPDTTTTAGPAVAAATVPTFTG